jgi:hypothetical protein
MGFIMMNCNIGDKAIINRDNPNGSILYKGDIVKILDRYEVNGSFYHDVKAGNGDEWTVFESDLDLPAIELPVGYIPEPQNLCDCGGYKVYGTTEAPAHSVWCSIFRGKKD